MSNTRTSTIPHSHNLSVVDRGKVSAMKPDSRSTKGLGWRSKMDLVMVGPVGFEPTTSAESFVYGYLHALRNFLISPRVASAYPTLDSGARRHSSLGPGICSGLARLRPLDSNRRFGPHRGGRSKIVGIKILTTIPRIGGLEALHKED